MVYYVYAIVSLYTWLYMYILIEVLEGENGSIQEEETLWE